MTKIADCITYFDEDLLLDIRFHELNSVVDNFIIVESTKNHQGIKKNLNFKISNFKKFAGKIIYLVKEDLEIDSYKSVNEKYLFNTPDWKREHSQRNYIMEGIKNFDDNDCILISDADEIPKASLIKKNFRNKNLFYTFNQKVFYYKLNLLFQNHWYGTVMTAKKNLGKDVSPSNLRTLKHPKRKGVRGFLYNLKHKIKVIDNGGWHFSYLRKPEDIIKKIEAFAHKELNTYNNKNISYIKKCIENRIDIFGSDGELKNRPQKLSRVDIDFSYPDYIKVNQKKFIDWID
jgi:beta-1,4-mannosyl-glycoprotein beta-1,4-N-acetylglucosaminyltransferase